jgi:hypothetical protein
MQKTDNINVILSISPRGVNFISLKTEAVWASINSRSAALAQIP